MNFNILSKNTKPNVAIIIGSISLFSKVFQIVGYHSLIIHWSQVQENDHQFRVHYIAEGLHLFLPSHEETIHDSKMISNQF